MLLGIGVAVVAAIALALVVVARRPDTFRIARSTVVNAPAEEIFPLINDLHLWQKWSPYEKRDPNMKRTYDGPQLGVGSSYAWAGNRQIGEGRLTIVESKPSERIAIKLEFFKPWKGTNRAEFTMKPSSNGTSVSWEMTGQQHFMCKLFSLFMNMDEMIGKDFESGLAELKRKAELTVPHTAAVVAS